MFIVFLPALNFRGNRSPYLWWFHKLLSAFGDTAAYICGDEYFSDLEQLLTAGRTDVSHDLARAFQYCLPDHATLQNQLRADVPLRVWQGLEERFPSNPLAAFNYYCLQDDEELRVAITDALDQIVARVGEEIEAVVTCVNCATLQKLCRARNLPLVHMELGPLRQPAFLQTAYFDFSGVNGGTEAHSRFDSDPEKTKAPDYWASVENLRSLFMIRPISAVPHASVDLGLGLQVEDDSNVVCYANGHSALSLINNGRRSLFEGDINPPILVRSHPGSFFSLQTLPAGLENDTSATSVDFVVRCRQIHSINSGVAVEGLLLDRAVLVRGACSFSYCVKPDTGECREPEFAFFLLNYLVPWHLAFQPDYIRWRMNNPTERVIRQRHLEGFMQDKIRLLELRVSELERSLRESEERMAQIKSSFVWRLLWPLRALYSICHKYIDRMLLSCRQYWRQKER